MATSQRIKYLRATGESRYSPLFYLNEIMYTENGDTEEEKDRVMVFVDGNNLYHRLVEKGWKTKIDIGTLAKRVAGNRNLVHTYYYNAPPPGGKPHTESGNAYLSWVAKTPNLTFRRSRLQQVRKSDQYGEYQSFNEKGGDTALSTDLVSQAANDGYDVAILITCDGDYEPAVRAVKDDYGKSVEVIYFEGRRPFALESCCLMRSFRLSHLVEYDYKPTRHRKKDKGKGRTLRVFRRRR